MSEQVFQDLPHVELLQWLARGSLKQNLLRAIRLWVWLRSLYGNSQKRLVLDDSFTYAEWRDAFFTPTHPKGDIIPKPHDSLCPCSKTTAEWLFSEKTSIAAHQWKGLMLAHTGMDLSHLDKQLQQRLFGVTRRSLQGDLETLAELGWLQYKAQKYHRVREFPPRPVSSQDEATATQLSAYELNFLQEDLVAIAETHAQKINGVQRLFLQLDYVIPRSTIDMVEDWQYKLRQLWAKTPVSPIKLTYKSARLGNTLDCIVYPVCIYYVQRAVYLCAYGQSPERKTDWYNFRLDRIHDMIALEWANSAIPSNLQKCYQQASLPNPDDIAIEMSKAWGFDFYLPSQLMLLRFDRNFHDRYIQNTFRHETFEAISYKQAKNLIQQNTKQPEQQQTLLKILENRSHKDAYYRLNYRHGDNNVSMRIRAWRPKAEVIMPWELRKSIADDVATEFNLYHDR
ncbi:CRISPR-associated protein [Scytonema hofmannii PCC 7110]|uniref:CRISPR-associated protein n=1 Tax=Scytonema hofmannii PCC 7110 TaxID=128403 RepID=A0A139WW05_9CYAN|nr:TIGR03985 family CRISPR-associated protein [Scytonema hofmannii]KYC36572.1 CRISPR-associated protein [Scytonema hofmannii PCC 7110]